jgi:hypothetical protein
MTLLVEVAPGRWRAARPAVPVTRSALPMPYVISDAMPPTEQVDGRFYESKAAFREVGRSLGLVEVGNDKRPPKQRATADPAVKRARREAIDRAAARYRNGERHAVDE